MGEQIIESYPGVVLEPSDTFKSQKIKIRVSIQGKPFIISRNETAFNFKVKPHMVLRIDLVKSGEDKRINISRVVPCELDREECEILKYI